MWGMNISGERRKFLKISEQRALTKFKPMGRTDGVGFKKGKKKGKKAVTNGKGMEKKAINSVLIFKKGEKGNGDELDVRNRCREK